MENRKSSYMGPPKLVVLLDPNHVQQTQRISLALLETIKELRESSITPPLEIYVGCSEDPGKRVRKTIRWLREARVDVPLIIFPGNPMQVSRRADGVLVPHLLNCTKPLVLVAVRLGQLVILFKKIISLLKVRTFPKRLPFDYFVLSPYSTVGEKTGARLLTNTEETFRLFQRKRNKKAYAVFLEAGSRSKVPIVKWENLIIKLREKFDHEDTKTLILTGGGIMKAEEVRTLFTAGSDRVVVSSALESTKNPEKILKDFLEVALEFQ